MKKYQAFKFQLQPTCEQEHQMRQFAGCCRFVWNKALELEKETYESTGKRLGLKKLSALLPVWKKEKETAFLADANAQTLVQSVRDLDRAYQNFFAKRAELPRFKKKGRHDSFRYPQKFKLDEGNRRIWLPKIGWVRYRKSRDIEGKPKNVTVSLDCGKWHVSIQTELEVPEPIHAHPDKWLGIDMGIVHFATCSDGTVIEPVNALEKYERKLARLQRRRSRKVMFSANWQKDTDRIARLHRKIANIRRDFLHKTSSAISKSHAVVVLEDLNVMSMTASGRGTVDEPGRNVAAKAGLNKAILDQGWGEFRRQLAYKLGWLGGRLVLVPPQYTSQTCSHCGCVDKNNRRTQAQFHCIRCGFEANADHNAALNILAAGQAVQPVERERLKRPR